MLAKILLSVALVSLLTWTGDADKQAPLRRAQAHRRTKLRRVQQQQQQPGATAKERTFGAGLRPGSGSAISVLGEKHEEGWQADQMVDDPARAGFLQRGGAGGVSPDRPRYGRKRTPGHGGAPRTNAMVRDEATPPGTRSRFSRMPSGSSSPNLLASFAGKNRVLVISAPHESDGYYRMMMSLLKPDVYCELAERHVHQVVIFHQEGEMGGKVRRVTPEGKVMEEPLDTALIPRLMSFLKLETGKFGMVLLRKTLQVEERYPYPVRLEAVYEVIDQSPVRRMEKLRQKGFVQKCKGAGVEGQVEEGVATAGAANPTIEKKTERKEFPKKPMRRPPQQTTTTAATTTTTTTRPTTTSTTTTTTRATTTTTPKPTTPTTTTRRTTTTTRRPTTTTTTTATTTTTTRRPTTTSTTTVTPTRRQTAKAPTPAGDNRIDKGAGPKQGGVVPVVQRPSKTKPGKRKNAGEKLLSNEYEDKQKEVSAPAVGEPPEEDGNAEADPGRGKGKSNHDTTHTASKKNKKKHKNNGDRSAKKAERRGGGGGKKNGKSKSTKHPEKEYRKPTPPKGTLASFLDHFENRRRLLLITSPTEDGDMYVQQRDEYLESVCEMAFRKITIVTIFGPLTNSTMKIDHYQLENDKPMNGLRQEDLVNQDLITELRKEFGMVHNDFYMVLTDLDMRLKQSYEVPITMKAVFNYLDTFSSRIREMELQKRDGTECKKEEKPRSLENFLSRFRWRRRLFVISAPNDEEWAYQQQLYALTSQACNLGLRHISILKLVGTEQQDMGGVLELYPINGSATVLREGLSAALVKDIRNYFQVSPEYFSMLLVGKDGNVKSWYPSPMWSMAIIYDLVDSMQLRRQEMAIQQSLGMRCPEDEYGGYGYHQHGYDHGYQEGYHQGYGY